MKILEAGHYYSVKGPTIWSVVGWEIMMNIRSNDDKNMLFIDDVHSLIDIQPEEAILQKIEFNSKPDFIIMESEVIEKAWEILKILKTLPRKRRAKMTSGKWYCSGFPLTNSGTPNCVLLDAGLTLLKSELGFQEGINILPKFYKEEQKKLLRLVVKALPEFHLQVILYDLEGNYWNIEDKA